MYLYPSNQFGASVAIRKLPDISSPMVDALDWDEAIKFDRLVQDTTFDPWYETERGFILAYNVETTGAATLVVEGQRMLRAHQPKPMRTVRADKGADHG